MSAIVSLNVASIHGDRLVGSLSSCLPSNQRARKNSWGVFFEYKFQPPNHGKISRVVLRGQSRPVRVCAGWRVEKPKTKKSLSTRVTDRSLNTLTSVLVLSTRNTPSRFRGPRQVLIPFPPLRYVCVHSPRKINHF